MARRGLPGVPEAHPYQHLDAGFLVTECISFFKVTCFVVIYYTSPRNKYKLCQCYRVLASETLLQITQKGIMKAKRKKKASPSKSLPKISRNTGNCTSLFLRLCNQARLKTRHLWICPYFPTHVRKSSGKEDILNMWKILPDILWEQHLKTSECRMIE